MASIYPLLAFTVAEIERAVQVLGGHFQPPRIETIQGHEAWRHETKHDLLASYLKCVRNVSALNACLVLLKSGHVQEVYALCRGIDEANEDVMFLATPLGQDGKPSVDQIRFVKEFFQEEFAEKSNVSFDVSEKRDRVSRKTIHAALGRLPSGGVDPSTMNQVHQTLHKSFSGFVHGAYVHIMELFNGRTYHTNGMLGTPKIPECEEALANYVYRASLAVRVVARRLGNGEVDAHLKMIGGDFAKQTNAY